MSKVIILGGGVAGMSAAHELIERGFEVEVYDRNVRYVGGKARSIWYEGPEDQPPYVNPLPGEHGFRFFPGFYRHVTDTMKRIPFQNGKSVYTNLVPTSRIMIARYGLKPIVTTASFPRDLSDLELMLHDLFQGADSGLTHEEEKFFAKRVWQLMTSSNARRQNDYERLGWWEYLEADRFSATYRSLLVEGLTRTLVAAKAETASTKTGGDIFLQLLYCMLDPTVNTDRVLNGPTNDRWLTPWLDYLKSKGVKYFLGHEVTSISMDASGKQIQSATIVDHLSGNGQTIEVSGDYFILATPVERAAPLLSPEMIKADRTLAFIQQLAPSVSWMNGIQYYLNVEVPVNHGHVICCNTAWAVTCISQIQFWSGYDIKDKGNGEVRGLLSVDISDWFTPGQFTTTKAAKDCSREEVAEEVWAQLKASLNVEGVEILRDDMRIDFYLDRDIRPEQLADAPVGAPLQQAIADSRFKRAFDQRLLSIQNTNGLCNVEPLLVNNVNTWDLRPSADCQIPNLFFAADYVKTNTDLATMEGANEAARRAVNALIQKSGANQPLCKVWNLKEPLLYRPLKWYDHYRWSKGLAWSAEIPAWLKLGMLFWLIFCLVVFVFEWLFSRLKK